MKKLIKTWIIGTPVRGTPIKQSSISTVMPVKGVSMEQWEKGEWSKIVNNIKK